MGASTELALVDHHCHGLVAGRLSDDDFQRWITESDRPPAPATTTFESPFGLAILAWCAPLLDLPAHGGPAEYLERRRALGDDEVARRLMRAAGVSVMIVDTGIAGLTGPSELGALAGASAHEVVRIERVAEEVIDEGAGAGDYVAAFSSRLEERAADAVGLKTIVAYRWGLDLPDKPPGSAEVLAAIEGEIARAESRGSARIDDPVLLNYGIWRGVELAADRRLPLQIHTGFGDTDVHLARADPALLTPFIRACSHRGVDLTLLHCYPFHRQAAYLAMAFPNVYFDLGLTLNHAVGGAARILAEAMEIAPFAKQLYSSDAIAIPELHYLGARTFRVGLDTVLDQWCAAGLADVAAAGRIARAIASENATRLYGLTR